MICNICGKPKADAMSWMFNNGEDIGAEMCEHQTGEMYDGVT